MFKDNVGRNRIRCSICYIAWLVTLSVLVLTYVVFSIGFNRKVNFFNASLPIGVHESEAIDTLGSPTFLWVCKGDVIQGPTLSDNKKYDVFVYSGLPFLRGNLILYFDSESRKLVKKGRSSHAPGWGPLI